jgi:parallel beta-helix repeat protein
MDARKRFASIGAVLVAALATTIAPASAATNTTRWVDGDGRAGPNGCNSSATAYKKIQAAVNASNDDDTVIVCPGTYRQQVRIRGDRDGLTLKSSTPFGATLVTPSSPSEVDGGVFMISVEEVDGVTVRGFKVLARTDGPCDDLGVAILVTGSRDAEIRGNRVMAPGTGAPGSSCEMGVGIAVVDGVFSDTGIRSASALVAFNEVRDAAFGGIVGLGQSRRVTMNAAHNSVRAYFRQGTPVFAIEGLSGGQFGIALLGNVRGEIQDNVVQGSTSAPLDGPGWLYGIVVGDAFVMTPTGNGTIDVHDNVVRRVGYGIAIVGADQIAVRRNQVSNTYYGIAAEVVTGSAIRRNTIGAKGFGLYLQGSAGNDLIENEVSGVGGTCIDDSTGSGTAGTDNHWAGNTATVGSLPPGICSAP